MHTFIATSRSHRRECVGAADAGQAQQARGLEFGTTGLHQPFPILVAKGRIFGRTIYEHLDANETVSKTYACFLFKIPKDYKGVNRLTYSGKRLTLHERDAGPNRDLAMEVGELFQR